jgi:DDE superfamily endonuclease
LPQNWAEDRKRRRKASVPEEISFKTKLEIALEHLRGACGAGVACGVVLTDAGRLPTLMHHHGSQKPAAISMLQCSVAKPSRRKNS